MKKQEFDNLFSDIFKSVAPVNSKFEIVGSYRRGAKNSGDIDIIITNKDDMHEMIGLYLPAQYTANPRIVEQKYWLTNAFQQ